MCSYKMPITSYQTTQRCITEDRTLHNHHCENFKSKWNVLILLWKWEQDPQLWTMWRSVLWRNYNVQDHTNVAIKLCFEFPSQVALSRFAWPLACKQALHNASKTSKLAQTTSVIQHEEFQIIHTQFEWQKGICDPVFMKVNLYCLCITVLYELR
jgi:hypothetical protein